MMKIKLLGYGSTAKALMSSSYNKAHEKQIKLK